MAKWLQCTGYLSLLVFACAACAGHVITKSTGGDDVSPGSTPTTASNSPAVLQDAATSNQANEGGRPAVTGDASLASDAAGSGGPQRPPDVVPTPIIGKCDGLGPVDSFEDITPKGLNLSEIGVVNVLVDPVHSGTVYCATHRQGLFKSTDCGYSWEKVNKGRNGDILDGGTLWSMAIDPIEPNTLYAGSLYSSNVSLFKSTNGGVDWDSLFPDGSVVANAIPSRFFQDLSIDPTDHLHIVVTFHDNCSAPGVGAGCIGETKDGGSTWALLPGPGDGWLEGAAPHVLGADEWLVSTPQNGLYYTRDRGAHYTRVGPGANLEYYRSTDGTYYVSSGYGLRRTRDPGQDWVQIPGAPNTDGLTGDGERIFSSRRDSEGQTFWVATDGDGTDWKAFPTPDMTRGSVHLRYDPGHHLLYSANTLGGLWRMVTR